MLDTWRILMGIIVLSVIFPFTPIIRRGGKFGASVWLADKNSPLDKSTSRLLSATSSSRVLIHPWQLCLFTTVNAELTSYPFYRRPYFFKFTPLCRPLRLNLTKNHIDQEQFENTFCAYVSPGGLWSLAFSFSWFVDFRQDISRHASEIHLPANYDAARSRSCGRLSRSSGMFSRANPNWWSVSSLFSCHASVWDCVFEVDAGSLSSRLWWEWVELTNHWTTFALRLILFKLSIQSWILHSLFTNPLLRLRIGDLGRLYNYQHDASKS